MQQVLVKKGEVTLEEVPPPALSENEVLVQTLASLISTGTELTGLSASSEPLIKRALNEPHHVKKALKMAAEKGFLNTYKIIKGMLDFGMPTGYSLAGRVVKIGSAVPDIHVGDLVACAGAKLANHAEYVAIPRLLLCKIPDGLDVRQAASVTLGAIALQGIRQTKPELGETIAVIGLGLIGQLTCQMLRAAGCRVIGFDLDASRAELAKKLGAEAVFLPSDKESVKSLTDGAGVDACIITATANSNEPLQSALQMTRKRGRIVVVGQVGLKVERSEWYEKEIDLKISCSYGPGRYDASYEEDGKDYPLPYVRWTENRNMEEYLRLLASNSVNFLALHPLEFSLQEAASAYEKLQEEKPLAILLTYGEQIAQPETKIQLAPRKALQKGKIRIAVIGAGSFAATTHLPNIAKRKDLFDLRAVVSKKGLTAKQYAVQYGASYCTADFEEVLGDGEIDAVLIATRHDLHAKMVIAALRAGKSVFVEKPLALNREELCEIKDFYKKNAPSPLTHHPLLAVGFNRRFSPFAQRIKELTAHRRNPLIVNYRVNAGYLPPDHWTQGPRGGGRIIGEACHFFDLFQFWTGAASVKFTASAIRPHTKDILSADNFSASITYEDGSLCNLLYTSLGPRELPKEYAEIYCDGRAYILDDYRALRVKGGSGNIRRFSQDKGHSAELEAFAKGLAAGEPPIPLENIFETTELSFAIDEFVKELKKV